MKSLVNYKTYQCSNCGIEYQDIYAYVHAVLGIVCNDCLNSDITDIKWA